MRECGEDEGWSVGRVRSICARRVRECGVCGAGGQHGGLEVSV